MSRDPISRWKQEELNKRAQIKPDNPQRKNHKISLAHKDNVMKWLNNTPFGGHGEDDNNNMKEMKETIINLGDIKSRQPRGNYDNKKEWRGPIQTLDRCWGTLELGGGGEWTNGLVSGPFSKCLGKKSLNKNKWKVFFYSGNDKI